MSAVVKGFKLAVDCGKDGIVSLDLGYVAATNREFAQADDFTAEFYEGFHGRRRYWPLSFSDGGRVGRKTLWRLEASRFTRRITEIA